MRFLHLYISLFFFAGSVIPVNAQFYQTTNAIVEFYSSAPVEDIEARSTEGISVFNSSNTAISFKIPVRSFRFEKALMQEHFNENYMESDKYPFASFKGKGTEGFTLAPGETKKLVLAGTLDVHGISKSRELPVQISKSKDGNSITIRSEFLVKCADHKIKIPKILWQNIAEIIDVTLTAEYNIIKE